jgi:hypothetical protein
MIITASYLKRATGRDISQPDLVDERICLEVAVANCVSDPLTIWRDLRCADSLKSQEFVDGWHMTYGLCGGGNYDSEKKERKF